METFRMNGKDKQDLELVLYRLDEQDQKRESLEGDINTKLVDIHEDISFIKENLFNPKEGVWAEVKENTRFRENANKWRGAIGAGFFGLVGKAIFDFFKGGA
tara:strand:- start:4 stop:309 length:306 start_codon:yes stop_codon:yes gene_type:complete